MKVTPASGVTVVGWVERVSLPGLGLLAVAAKIDTGARTSALHVLHLRRLHALDSRGRDLVDVTVPGPSVGAAPRTFRFAIVEWTEVRDTSGRLERRPVVETSLVLGPIHRRVRLTLTDRADMTYPVLIGRSALKRVLVDPAARFRLSGVTAKSKTKARRKS